MLQTNEQKLAYFSILPALLVAYSSFAPLNTNSVFLIVFVRCVIVLALLCIIFKLKICMMCT